MAKKASGRADFDITDKWISVKDRLPEDDREVLATYKITEKGIKWRGVETASCIAGNGEVNWVSLWDEYRIPNGSKRVITHWMPLPKPPKEENDAVD